MAQRRKNRNKWIWWGVGLAVVAIIVIIIVVLVMQNNSSEEKKNEVQKDESSVVERQDVVEGEQVTEENSDQEQAERQKVKQYEGEDPNEAEELSGAVTYAGVVDGNLMIRVSIDQYLTNGTCDLTLSRGGAIIYSDTANIVGDVSTATCEGFDVPVGGLGGGSTEINIKLNADGKSGIIRGEVDI